MKQLLLMLAVMGFATTAYGVAIELQFGPGTTGVVDASGDTVTLMGSDFAQIDVWARDLSWGFWWFGVGVDVQPPLAEPPDFTYEGSVPGPIMWPSCFRAPTLDGSSFAYGCFYPYFGIDGVDPVLLFTMYIHCTGVPSEHDIFSTDFGGAAFVMDGSGADYQGVDYDDSVTIIQVPEPASLALLVLGGLVLTRRPENPQRQS